MGTEAVFPCDMTATATDLKKRVTRGCYGDLSEEPAAAYPWTVYANTRLSVSIALFYRKHQRTPG